LLDEHLIARKSLLILNYTAIAAILNFVGLFFITNRLGPDIYGEFVLMMSLVTTINFIVDIGFDSAHIKRVSEGRDINTCFGTYLRIKFVLIGCMVVLGVLALFIWEPLTGATLSEQSRWAIIFFIGYYFCADFSAMISLTFFAKGEVFKYAFIGITEPLFRVPIVVFLSFNDGDVRSLAMASFIASLFVLTIAIVLMKQSNIRPGKLQDYQSYYSFAIPISITAVIGILGQNIDRLVIGAFYPSSDVAFFAAAMVMLSIVSMISSAVGSVTFPSFSKMISEGRTDEIRHLTMKAEFYIAAIALPILTIITIFPYDIITIFGARFSNGAVVLQISATALLISMINTVYLSQINAMNMPKITAKLIIIWFLVYVSSLLILVPPKMFGVQLFGLSIIGACIASLIGNITLLVLTRYSTFGISKTLMSPDVPKAAVISIISGGVVYVIFLSFPIPGLVGLFVYGMIMLAIYSTILFGLKIVKIEDVKFFTDTLNIRKMYSYIKDEIKEK